MRLRANAGRVVLFLAFSFLLICSLDVRHPGRGTPWRTPASIVQAADQAADPRLKPAYRFEKGGWIYVHLEGTPGEIGFQHGYLLAPEIADAFEAVKLLDTHDTRKDWDFFRQSAHDMLWPHIDQEYQEELAGIVGGREGARRLHGYR